MKIRLKGSPKGNIGPHGSAQKFRRYKTMISNPALVPTGLIAKPKKEKRHAIPEP